MKKRLLARLLICAALTYCITASAAPKEFSFAVIDNAFSSQQEDEELLAALSETDQGKPAFVVVNGIKSAAEPCSDALYSRRKSLLDAAHNPLFVSLAARDWTGCKLKNGRSAAFERLNRVRELFFSGEFSLGTDKMRLVRQSTAPKFRSYGENARWEYGGIMFATIDLPSDNNHYLPYAGRNSEFEDRLIANNHWLHRVFLFAAQRKTEAVVLFCDGDPFALPQDGSSTAKRDGFKEIRQKILSLTARFTGKVLLIHGQGNADSIVWRGNLGTLAAASGWTKISVDPASANLFSVSEK